MEDYHYYKEGSTWKEGQTEDGDYQYTTDQQDLSQRIDAALTLNLGEWKFDRSKGIPIFRDLLTKGFKDIAVSTVRKALKQDELSEIRTIERIEIKGIEDRHATLEGEIKADFGIVPIESLEIK